MNAFTTHSTPQLKLVHKGKVRDSYQVNNNYRLLIATDRLSCFDKVLPSPMPGKGVILTQMAKQWFSMAEKVLPTHFVKDIAPNVSLVKEAKPIPLEIIVRSYLTGSLWRRYLKGERIFGGLKLPENMTKNQRFPQAIVTPTTKEAIDRPIDKETIIKEGWATQSQYEAMEKASLELFAMGSEYCQKKGVVLVDTKYEFGMVDGKLTLIDEIHTPDSSRFWLKEALSKSKDPESMDKEFIRQWLLQNKPKDNCVPKEALSEGIKRYEAIFQRLFENPSKQQVHPSLNIGNQVYYDLVSQGFIKKGLIAIVMGSKSDMTHAEAIAKNIKSNDVAIHYRVVSAHKNGERIKELAQDYNNTLEPTCVIAVAGRSNGLGGALAANLSVPVISCPPFKDRSDIALNIHSSLMMPSKAPALTTIYPEQAALAALRTLNLQDLRKDINSEIKQVKDSLENDDFNCVDNNIKSQLWNEAML